MNHRNPHDAHTIRMTAPAWRFLDKIAVANPDLPAPYITLSTHSTTISVSIGCSTMPAFEEWRAALGASTDQVTWDRIGYLTVEMETENEGTKIMIHLYADTSVIPVKIPQQPNGSDR